MAAMLTGKTKKTRVIWIGLLLVIAMLVAGMVAVMVPGEAQAANPPEPTYDWATVDGDDSEWDTSDYFADMIKAGGQGNQTEVLSKLYLRYDCKNNILYALVLAQPGYAIDADTGGDNHFIKFGTSGPELVNGTSAYRPPDGTAPDFEFVGLSQDGKTAEGWEASAPVSPGSYTDLNVHAQIDNEQTSAVENKAIDLVINCPCEGADANLDTFVTNSTTNPAGPITVKVTIYHDNPPFGTLTGTDTELESQTYAISEGDTQPFDFQPYPPGHYATEVSLLAEPGGTSISPSSPQFASPNDCPGGQSGFTASNDAPTAIALASFNAVSPGGARVALPLALAGITMIAIGGLRLHRRKA
jgi:hypothetical protein